MTGDESKLSRTQEDALWHLRRAEPLTASALSRHAYGNTRRRGWAKNTLDALVSKGFATEEQIGRATAYRAIPEDGAS